MHFRLQSDNSPPGFATTLLDLLDFVSKETREQTCPLRDSPITDDAEHAHFTRWLKRANPE